MAEQRANTSQSTILIILLAAFAISVGLYYSLRFGGWSMEGDAGSQTTATIGMVKSGEIDYAGAYTNGFGYTAQLAFLNIVTGLNVQELQLGSSLWVFTLALVAFITFREFLGSAGVAALGVMLLFLQPDFLFYIVRGSHEKFVWMCALLMLFLLAHSFHYLHQPVKLLLFTGLFYLVFWSFTSSNFYFAAVFISALALSFMGGWGLTKLASKSKSLNGDRANLLQRLIIISLAGSALVFIFINYTYLPALSSYYYFSDLWDKVSLLLLGGQPVDTPASYQAFARAWRSQGAYLFLTGLQWVIVGISLIGWGFGLFRLSRLNQKRWLLWLMYSAFGALLAFGVAADYLGFMSANLQLRMFTAFCLFSSPMAAAFLVDGFRSLRVNTRKLAAAAAAVIIIVGAATVALKVTNDPAFGNQWLFYTPAELAPASWLDKAGVQKNQLWVDTWEHLSIIYNFWEGSRPFMPYQYGIGTKQSPVPYTLITDLTRIRANRSGISMPDTDDQLQVYDNGQVQIYHRRPITPYQR